MSSTSCVSAETAAAPASATPSAPEATGVAAAVATGVYSRIEAQFTLPGLAGNPFDFTENDIRVTLRLPDGATVEVPAFFDGGETWRARWTPSRSGRHEWTRVTRNGKEVTAKDLSDRTATVAGEATRPGFLRIKNNAFEFDNGAPYYPIGHNVGWGRGGDSGEVIPRWLTRMGEVGENWSRIWMCHWDAKNLDWVPGKSIPLGSLDLDVARRWDRILEAADKSGIYVQVVLQHHGPYSTTVNPNWGEHPWNAKNGGFLQKPEEFFTNPKALALTRAKYRYIIARYGYSPAVLAWELFNEVEWVDAVRNGPLDTVLAWHREMAAFLRAQDPQRHLVTSSSDVSKVPGLYETVDFLQPHRYAGDPVTAVGGDAAERAVTGEKDAPRSRPVFFGEIGPSGDLKADDGRYLSGALWVSMMGEAEGAAQYWDWENIEDRNLYPLFAAATGFMKEIGPGTLHSARPVAASVKTDTTGEVSFEPRRGWENADRTSFTLHPDGSLEGIGGLPSFLQGTAHREMTPYIEFVLEPQKPATFGVHLRQSARMGANVVMKLDGTTVSEKAFPGADQDQNIDVTLTVSVPPGKHTVRLENTGADWVVIDRIQVSPYGSGVRALAKATSTAAAAYLYRPSAGSTGRQRRNNAGAAAAPAPAPPTPPVTPVSGTLTLPDLSAGQYNATWWDTRAGKALKQEKVQVTAGKPLVLTTPSFERDLALAVTPANRASSTSGSSGSGIAALSGAKNLRDLAGRVDKNLDTHVLGPWFPRAVDTKVGGFQQEFDANWKPSGRTSRSIVYQSRLTWVAAQAARRSTRQAAAYREWTRHGLDYLGRGLWDKEQGGFFWEVDEAGKPVANGEKHAYGISFGIYAAATGYQTLKNPADLDLAKRAFDWLDKNAHDAANGGYYEALTREGKPILTAPAGGRNDFIGTAYGLKSMNTHIHLLEAFTALYEVWPDARLRTRLEEVFTLVRDKVVAEPGYLHLYFKPDWTPVPTDDSFGHDVETAYLLVEAAEALGRGKDTKTAEVARRIMDHALQYGWDAEQGSFFYEGEPSGHVTNKNKIWWTQAEGLNALLLMHEHYGKETPKYGEAFLRQWAFIEKHQIDARQKGWFGTVRADGTPVPNEAKSDAWKDPYHQGRALLNVSAMLRRLANE